MAYIIDWEKEGTYLKFYGAISIGEVRQCNDELYSDERFYDTKYQLCDYLDVEKIDVEEKEVKAPAGIDKGASLSLPTMKVALVTNDDYLKELCRQYIETSNVLHTTWEFYLCERIEEARKWIATE